ncbi:MAG: LysM peptidoglycan-binding domain-containing protein [Clostridia bacterium]|nr:LysM peptidoglycan-binding domain-containing protein [Clostridia bacterium]
MYGDGSLSEIARAEADVIGGYFGLKKKKDPDPGYVEYTVKPGDTLIGIARKYGTTYKILAEYNGIKDPDLIHTGQIIKIPCPAEINVGDVVRLREGVYTYFPGGKKFSSWVKDYDYVVSKTADNSGGPVYRGGARCVLLGAKVDRKSGEHGSPINSWASLEYIEKVYYENKQER